jgi:hypothetical protein
MDTKEEVKKVLLTEPLKQLIGRLFASLSPLLIALIPQVRNKIQDSIPFSLLLVVAFIELTIILGLLTLVVYLNSQKKNLEKQIESIPISRFGVYWDKQQNPLCPSCKSLLNLNTLYRAYVAGMSPPDPKLYCLQCKKYVDLSDDNGILLTLMEAKKKLSESVNAT